MAFLSLPAMSICVAIRDIDKSYIFSVSSNSQATCTID